MPSRSIDLVWIVVRDFKQALKFYTETVGLQLMECQEQYGWAELQGASGVRLGIAQECSTSEENSFVGPGQNAVLTFNVDDIEETTASMQKKGVVCLGKIQEVPGHVKMQLMRDPDGNHFQMVQMVHAPVCPSCCC
jgi:predicted enzyme related to lactoylglutathione lyase